MTQYDTQLRTPRVQVWKRRMFDWGLKTALIWVIFTGLKQRALREM